MLNDKVSHCQLGSSMSRLVGLLVRLEGVHGHSNNVYSFPAVDCGGWGIH